MKKFFLMIVAIAALILSLFTFISGSSYSSYDDYDDYPPIQAYYGCPNSKKVNKLNLLKKKIFG